MNKKVYSYLKRTTALAAVAAMLAAGTACDEFSLPNLNTSNTTASQTNKETLKTREQLEQEGITAEDVLKVYDNLAAKISEKSETYNDLYKGLKTDFVKISTPFIGFLGVRNYYKADDFTPSENWHTNPATINNVYPISFQVQTQKESFSPLEDEATFGIDADTFEKLMSAFNQQSKIFKEEDFEPHHLMFKEDFEFLLDKEVYPYFTITRETINNATEEQLWTLYNTFESIRIINFNEPSPELKNIQELSLE